MKRLFIILVLMVGITAVFAQYPLAKRQSQLNLGFGLTGWGVPVYIGFDHGVHKDISMGAEFSFRSIRHDDHKDHSVIGISGNTNYHFNHILSIPRDWDFYAGINVGYYIVSNSDENSSYHSQLRLAGQVGGRYYFNNNLGVNLEFGGGNAFSGGKLGLSVKL